MTPAPDRRTGLQAEVLISLATVMMLATVVLTAVLVIHNEARLRDLLGRALLAEARSPGGVTRSLVPGTTWWRVARDGSLVPQGPVSGAIDVETRLLARDALAARAPLLRPGALWEPIRFAVPDEDGRSVRVARLPRAGSLRMRAAPLAVALGVLVADVVIFTAFGAGLLRRRLVLPLRRLAAGARAVADGDEGARIVVEGTREAAEVATAFNEMTASLEGRSRALEKAVVNLRETNRSLREARAGLDRAQRLASVGRLAAGVAHEVGNPMAALLTFLELARRDPGISAAGVEKLDRAAQQGERVRRILRQLLDFSRPPRAESVAFDLAAVAEETVGLVAAQRSASGIRFQVHRDGEPPLARGDPGSAAQILLNLVVNATDAVRGEPQAGVTLLVRTGALCVRDGEPPDLQASRARPDAVECLVMDNGPGVSAEDAERVFDPFFTTKPPGEGTGLGLSNALRLAEEQGGSVDLLNPGESGARLVFRLPVTQDPASALRGESTAIPCEVRSAVRSEGAPRDRAGGETIQSDQ